MGLWDLFKGYAFFKLVGLGIGFIILGIFATAVMIVDQDLSLLICNIPFLLVGGGAMYLALKIWRGEEESSVSASSPVGVGYSKEEDLMTCPECGEEKMEVELDGSGFCKNCGHTTREYYEEMESGDK